MNTFLPSFLAFFLILCGSCLAQNPSPNDIQDDFDKTFEKYYAAAIKFVDGLGVQLDARISTFIAAHQRLIDQLNGLKNLNGTNLDESNVKIINEALTFVETLLSGYASTLDRDLIVKELDRHLGALKSNVSRAQDLIDELKKWVTQLPILGQCWTSTRDELGSIINNGFIQARDAAVFAITNANSTFNIIELLVSSTLESNKFFISSCQNDANSINSCIASFLNMARSTLPANVNYWATTIENSVRTNLQIADSLIQAAAANAISSIPSIATRIENCLRNVGNVIIG